MRISVELIPRGEAGILADAATVRALLPQADTVNVPDLTRFPIRSWDACALAVRVLPRTIPHLRAIDVPPGDAVPLADEIVALGIREVLVVKGDPPRDLGRRTYPNSSEALIRRIKRHHPGLRVYAGFDPYRNGFREEMEGVERKLAAGADGFFTQPLFDLRLMAICAEMLAGIEVFWGISPVLGERSRAYWETTNRVVFPAAFRPDMDWNLTFARDALAAAREAGGNAYLMPIRVDLAAYLRGLAGDGASASRGLA